MLREWFSQPPGSLIARAEGEALAELLPGLFGYFLVELGRVGDVDVLAYSKVLKRISADMGPPLGGVAAGDVRLRADALPFASDSIDVLIMAHVLEFASNPHEALREGYRVLAPEGHLLITVLNAWSLVALSRRVRRGCREAGGAVGLLGLARIKDWVALLGFDLVSARSCFFRPPIGSARVLERLRFMEPLGARFWPIFGASHVLLARKRTVTLTPVRPRWKSTRRLAGIRLVEPTRRAGDRG